MLAAVQAKRAASFDESCGFVLANDRGSAGSAASSAEKLSSAEVRG